MTTKTSLADAWIKSVQLANQRALIKMSPHKNAYQVSRLHKIDRQIKRNLGIVVDKALSKRR